ncbi:hypothetical protein BH11PAT4_BH11PAT4_1330 [soil metagenome]
MGRLRTITTALFLLFGVVGLPYLASHQDAILAVSSSATVDQKQAGRTAILSLLPPVGKLNTSSKQSIAVKIDTGGSLVQAVSFVLSFPPDRVKVDEVSLSGSFCTITPTYSINNKQGTVSLSCRSNSPGLTGQLGTVATLVTTPLQSGDAAFQFDQTASSVTAKVSEKDVLSYAVDRVVSYGETPSNHLTVTSQSHPTGSSCSYKATAEMSWLRVEGATTFEYGWSEDPSQEPGTSTGSTTISLPTKPGTTQFFSIRTAGEKGAKGPITRNRVVSCR